MNLQEIGKRYKGIQDILGKLKWSDCCLFLTLCEIIEEVNQKPADLIDILRYAYTNNYISSDFTILDSPAILSHATGKTFIRDVYSPEEFAKIGITFPADWFSVEKWKRIKEDDTVVLHFRRRFCDTVNNSQTVKYGKLEEYYVYKIA